MPKEKTAAPVGRTRKAKPFEDIACPICLEDDKIEGTAIVSLGCGHWLHKSCAEGLVKAQCPLCRAPMITIPKSLRIKIKNNETRDRIKTILLSSFQFQRRVDVMQATMYVNSLNFPYRPQTIIDATMRVITSHERIDDMMIQLWVSTGQVNEPIPSIVNEMIKEIIVAMRQPPLPDDNMASQISHSMGDVRINIISASDAPSRSPIIIR